MIIGSLKENIPLVSNRRKWIVVGQSSIKWNSFHWFMKIAK